MCDEHIHQGLTHDPTMTRRSFGVSAAAAVALAAAPSFARADTKVVERDVDIKTADGTADAALFYPEGKGPWPAVLLWTDILGLRPVFRDMGRDLASQGYVVLIPNPFYRVQRAPVVSGSFDFNKPEDRNKVMPMAGTITQANSMADSVTYIAYLDTLPQTNKKKKAGVQGYCMGGPLTFRTAAAVPNRIGAAATFHGGGLVTDKPDSPHLLIPKMKCEAYCAVAANDDQREPESKNVLKNTFADNHLKARVEVYEGAQHGWSVKGSAVYNQASAERGWTNLTDLYKRDLA